MKSNRHHFIPTQLLLPVMLLVLVSIIFGAGIKTSPRASSSVISSLAKHSVSSAEKSGFETGPASSGTSPAKATLLAKTKQNKPKKTVKAKPKTKPLHREGIVTFAEPVNERPDFIFPIQGHQVFDTANYQDFDYLMYRPLYWFSGSPEPKINEPLSLADPPVFSDNNTVVTIKMKMWSWSDGEKVNAEDVAFWLNLVKIEGPQLRFAPYSQTSIPADLHNVQVLSPSVIRLTLDSPTNPKVFTDNELSQIIPLPLAWDVYDVNGQPGQGGCASAAFTSVTLNAENQPASSAAETCENVYEFLAQESGYEPISDKYIKSAYLSFASNPLWQVVDGPWRLVSMSSSGEADFEPNNAYSGPVKPKIAEFVEIPFTSYSDEAIALALGQLTIGYLPLPTPSYNSGSAPSATTTTVTIPITSSSGQILETISNTKLNSMIKRAYQQFVYYGNNVDFGVYNFYQNSSLSGKLLRLPYMRKVLQYLVNQPAIIKNIYGGLATPTYSLVSGDTSVTGALTKSFKSSSPVTKKVSTLYGSPNLSKAATTKDKAPQVPVGTENPYSYDPAAAIRILKNYGWKINSGGTDVCMSGIGCGTSIPQGTQLQLQISYSSGDITLQDELETEAKSFSAAGVEVGLAPESEAQLLANFSNCVLQTTSCNFAIEDFGGWNFGLSYDPTGQSLLDTSAAANISNFSSARYQSLLAAFLSGDSSLALNNYLQFLETDLPVLYQPTPANELLQVKKDLGGFTGFGPSGSITPESWSFVGKKK